MLTKNAISSDPFQTTLCMDREGQRVNMAAQCTVEGTPGGDHLYRFFVPALDEEIVVSASDVVQLEDGAWKISDDSDPILTGPREVRRIPVIQEELEVTRSHQERTIKLEKSVTEREQLIEETLTQQDVQVERRPIGRVLAPDEQVRQREEPGGDLIIPVVRERLVVRKERVLVEEIHVRRQEQQQHLREGVVLREEHVHITQE